MNASSTAKIPATARMSLPRFHMGASKKTKTPHTRLSRETFVEQPSPEVCSQLLNCFGGWT